jgi:hypothetical protein
MLHHGSGTTLGGLFRFSMGEPASQATQARAEVTYFDADYLPSYFDAYHGIFLNQYLPAAYTGSNGLTYYPTKLGYLRAMEGGPRRIGGYAELTHSVFNWITVGISARAWAPAGSKADFEGPSFADISEGCQDNGRGDLDCPGRVTLEDSGFTALRLHVELPFRKFLQAFASYEIFSTTAEDGFSIGKLDGDNELLFAGARVMVLPFLFLQAEARRYFFLQRVTDVDLTNLTVSQDQNVHANWTFAVGAYLGYEFN